MDRSLSGDRHSADGLVDDLFRRIEICRLRIPFVVHRSRLVYEYVFHFADSSRHALRLDLPVGFSKFVERTLSSSLCADNDETQMETTNGKRNWIQHVVSLPDRLCLDVVALVRRVLRSSIFSPLDRSKKNKCLHVNILFKRFLLHSLLGDDQGGRSRFEIGSMSFGESSWKVN